MTREINVHYVSKVKWSLCDENDSISGIPSREDCFTSVHVNAMNFLLLSYYTLGETEGLKYIKDVLTSQGVNSTPLLSSSGEGGCCAVQ
ncbi:MAG: hypothetical protein LBD60_03190 [Puniceicoccales bacterium]|jgi:hypothetical protein|nr:hypothetical protein [Puniceicoccales bacterium]